MGWTYLHLGEHEKSIEAFKKALKINPDHGGARNGLGQNYMATGKLEEAKIVLTETVNRTNKEMGEAVAVKRGVTAAWISLVRLHVKMKNPDEAIKWAERYLKHKPDEEMMKELLDEAQAMKKNGSK